MAVELAARMMTHLALSAAQGNGGAPSVSPITTLIIGLSAAVVGSLLSLIGGFVSDFFASRREERRQEREDRNLRERFEREDRLRREQQEHEEKLRVKQSRVRAYQEFIQAATLPDYVAAPQREDARIALNKGYIEVQLYASDDVASAAELLYDATDKAIGVRAEEFRSTHRQRIDDERANFFYAVRQELERGD